MYMAITRKSSLDFLVTGTYERKVEEHCHNERKVEEHVTMFHSFCSLPISFPELSAFAMLVTTQLDPFHVLNI